MMKEFFFFNGLFFIFYWCFLFLFFPLQKGVIHTHPHIHYVILSCLYAPITTMSSLPRPFPRYLCFSCLFLRCVKELFSTLLRFFSSDSPNVCAPFSLECMYRRPVYHSPAVLLVRLAGSAWGSILGSSSWACDFCSLVVVHEEEERSRVVQQ